MPILAIKPPYEEFNPGSGLPILTQFGTPVTDEQETDIRAIAAVVKPNMQIVEYVEVIDPGPPQALATQAYVQEVFGSVPAGGSDAAFATWVGQTGPNSLTRDAILAIVAGMAPGLPTVKIDDHGAVGDGVTNDDAAFAAAKAAATALGGAVILLGPKRYRINTAFTPGRWNSLRAPMDALSADPIEKYCIVLGSATAKVTLGGAPDGRGGTHGNFNIDANNTGDPDGALVCTVNDQVVAPIVVKNSPGIGYKIYASQNSKFVHPTADFCRDGVVVDGGSGGLTIENLHSTSPTRYGLWIHDSNPGGHPSFGYQYGCADILFIKPLVEQYANTATNLVRIDSGSRIKFEQPGLSVNGQSLSGHVVHICNDDFPSLVAAEVEFSSGNYHGGPIALEKMFYIKGTNPVPYNKLVVNGQSMFQQSAALFTTDGPTQVVLDDEMWTVLGTVASIFDASNPASSMFFWRKIQRTGIVYATPDAAGAFTGHVPIAVRKSTDGTSGARFYIQNDGTMGFPNGTNFVPVISITPDLTNKFFTLTGLKTSGRRVSSVTSVTVSAAGTTLNTDCSAINERYIVLMNSAGTITTWNLNNPVDGQELEIWLHRAGAQTATWPTNIRWDANTAPAMPAAGTYTIVHLVYIAAVARWYEHHKRTEGVVA